MIVIFTYLHYLFVFGPNHECLVFHQNFY